MPFVSLYHIQVFCFLSARIQPTLFYAINIFLLFGYPQGLKSTSLFDIKWTEYFYTVTVALYRGPVFLMPVEM